MITLFRWIRLKQLTIKWKLAIMQFINSELTKIAKNPEEIEKKILPYLAYIIHDSNLTNNEVFEKYREMVTNEFNHQKNL